jgi:hypothetical protein
MSGSVSLLLYSTCEVPRPDQSSATPLMSSHGDGVESTEPLDVELHELVANMDMPLTWSMACVMALQCCAPKHLCIRQGPERVRICGCHYIVRAMLEGRMRPWCFATVLCRDLNAGFRGARRKPMTFPAASLETTVYSTSPIPNSTTLSLKFCELKAL